MRNLFIAAALVGGLAAPGTVMAQDEYDPITEFPDAIEDDLQRYLWEARDIAGEDLYPAFAQRCILDQVYPVLDDLMQKAGYVEPAQAFDDLYFVGTTRVSAWAIDTGEGLVVLDSLNNAELAENVLVAGLEKFGFSGEDIAYVIINHEHGDHYGGARYLQETFGAKVIASDVAWVAMADKDDAPIRDIEVTDGQSMEIGDRTFQFYVTPGHTDGALSMIFPVTDRGEAHVAAMFGGFGIPRSAEGKDKQVASLQRWATITGPAGVDVLIGNHQVQDQSLYHFELLRHRPEGNAGELPNPFVMAHEDGYGRFLQVQELCVRVKAARDGQSLTM